MRSKYKVMVLVEAPNEDSAVEIVKHGDLTHMTVIKVDKLEEQ